MLWILNTSRILPVNWTKGCSKDTASWAYCSLWEILSEILQDNCFYFLHWIRSPFSLTWTFIQMFTVNMPVSSSYLLQLSSSASFWAVSKRMRLRSYYELFIQLCHKISMCNITQFLEDNIAECARTNILSKYSGYANTSQYYKR